MARPFSSEPAEPRPSEREEGPNCCVCPTVSPPPCSALRYPFSPVLPPIPCCNQLRQSPSRSTSPTHSSPYKQPPTASTSPCSTSSAWPACSPATASPPPAPPQSHPKTSSTRESAPHQPSTPSPPGGTIKPQSCSGTTT